MQTDELVKFIKDKVDKDVWQSLVRDRSDEDDQQKFLEAVGLPFEFVDEERSVGSGDYDGWDFVFKIGEKHYLLTGYYHSEMGVEVYDWYDIYEVKLVEKLVKSWETV